MWSLGLKTTASERVYRPYTRAHCVRTWVCVSPCMDFKFHLKLRHNTVRAPPPPVVCVCIRIFTHRQSRSSVLKWLQLFIFFDSPPPGSGPLLPSSPLQGPLPNWRPSLLGTLTHATVLAASFPWSGAHTLWRPDPSPAALLGALSPAPLPAPSHPAQLSGPLLPCLCPQAARPGPSARGK